ncbi:MAG: hypothetical protein J6A01_08630 [Proteobacteria bacterium]|nr:hypothetical protein [Pseudomonadota bacterium]
MIAPTLLVGLGGIGSKIVSKVANRVREEIDESLQNRIAYAVFDTDINELQEIHLKNSRITPIQTSTKLTVGEYLNLDAHARDGWFPVNPILNSKTLTEGAGQVRAISRLAFETAVRAGEMEALHQTIESLYKLEQNQAEQALRIVVASSLCGGTGSGLILPVALYIRNFLSTRFRQSANIMRGFFLMPEILYHVIPGEVERNNLRCNAYATIRELDAFLMKGDGTLPAQFDGTFSLEFPRPGSNEYDEYNVRPYDFCFLFDAQNTQGRKLNSYGQYLEHAANCIYAQSIGPMNKRSNSSEDNTIRELCAERGRNRYAGAGSSSIVYPIKDVEKYIALNWTKQCVSESWLQFDKTFFQKGNNKDENRNRTKDYCLSVTSKAESNNLLAKYIIEQCTILAKDPGKKTKSKWVSYIDALKAVCEKHWPDDKIRKEIESKSDIVNQEGTPNDSDIQDSMNSLVSQYNLLKKSLEETTKSWTRGLFDQRQFNEQDKEIPDHSIQKYIKNDGKTIHPNAIRFFISMASLEIHEKAQNVSRELDKLKEDIDGSVGDGLKEAGKKKGDSVLNSLTGKAGNLEDKEGATNWITQFKEDIIKYKNLFLQKAVFEYAETDLSNIRDSIEAFYDSLQEGIQDVDKELRIISKKFMPYPGRTTRYVCATKEMLEKMVQANPYTGNANAVDPELSLNILNKVFEFADLKANEPEKRVGFFRSMFTDQIVGHFIKELKEAHSSKIYMNVIDAIEREIELSKKEADPNRIDQAVTDIINDTRKLAAPFIESPLGEHRPPVAACSYHPSLDPGDDSPRSALIGKVLNNYGAVPDDDIPPEMILFYQSVYGLRANILSKFAPSKKLLASNEIRDAGEYYKAYFDITNQIVPKTSKTPVITPHIDKTWHIINVMPDLDETSQKNQEDRIYRAFLYAWLYKYIRYEKYYQNKIYALSLKGSKSEEFVVSNKTPCDRYYEVLDALIINPVVVGNILKSVEERINKELNRTCNLKFESSELMQRLNSLTIQGADTSEEDKPKDAEECTLFDLAVLLKQSTPPSEFRTEVGCDMLVSMFRAMLDYIKRITAPMEVPNVFGDFVNKQYEKFKANCSRYARFGFNHYFWELIRSVVDLLQSEEFAETGLYEAGERIDEDFSDFSDHLLS